MTTGCIWRYSYNFIWSIKVSVACYSPWLKFCIYLSTAVVFEVLNSSNIFSVCPLFFFIPPIFSTNLFWPSFSDGFLSCEYISRAWQMHLSLRTGLYQAKFQWEADCWRCVTVAADCSNVSTQKHGQGLLPKSHDSSGLPVFRSHVDIIVLREYGEVVYDVFPLHVAVGFPVSWRMTTTEALATFCCQVISTSMEVSVSTLVILRRDIKILILLFR